MMLWIGRDRYALDGAKFFVPNGVHPLANVLP